MCWSAAGRRRRARRHRSLFRGSARGGAAELSGEALSLWRGSPLADITSDVLRGRELPRRDQRHLQAVDYHIDAQIHLKRLEHLIPQLRELSRRYLLREHVYARLMRALARTGRFAKPLTPTFTPAE